MGERCDDVEQRLEDLINQAVADVEAAVQHCDGLENRLSVATKQPALAATAQVTPTTVPPVQEKPLRITIVGAAGLLDGDFMPGSGKSDPFCTCELLDKP